MFSSRNARRTKLSSYYQSTEPDQLCCIRVSFAVIVVLAIIIIIIIINNVKEKNVRDAGNGQR